MKSSLMYVPWLVLVSAAIPFACGKNLTGPEKYTWQVAKQFDREINVFDISILGSWGWALGSRNDFTDPLHPKSHAILLHTTDRWNTFSEVRLPTNTYPRDMYFISEKKGWIVGEYGEPGDTYGTVLKTEDGGLSWSRRPTGTTSPLRTLFFKNPNEG